MFGEIVYDKIKFLRGINELFCFADYLFEIGVRMKIYKVGGAVRDQIIGKKPQDNDYVVVGSSIDEMKKLGFKSVGKHFPVFLHPETKEEYALARKEVKTGNKHTDFEFVFTPDVSLKEDLERRDLTCNAIAFDEGEGKYIDYFGGKDDIQNRVLRHINAEHFVEDPLRLLRVCRFAAQLDFEVAPQTKDLLKKMVADGAMKYLTPERIFEEVVKALKAEKSSVFFVLMHDIGALKEVMPELDDLFDVPEKEKYHPEKTTFGHVMTALDVLKNAQPLIKFAILTHDFGKALTPKDILPSHHGHETKASMPIRRLCQRLKVPNIWRDFALKCGRFHMHYFKIFEMRAVKIKELIEQMRIGHRSFLEEYITVCRADFESSACENREDEREKFELKAQMLRFAQKNLDEIKAQDLPQFDNMPKDEQFGQYLRDYKIQVLDQKIKEFKKEKGLLM